MNYKDEFNPKFQSRILSLLVRDRDFITKYDDVIKPSYFTNPSHKLIAKVIEDYFYKYKTVPTYEVTEREVEKLGGKLSISISNITECLNEVKVIFTQDLEDISYVKEQVIDFAKKRGFKEAVEKAIDIWSTDGDYEVAKSHIESALKIGVDKNDLGSFYLKEYKTRLEERIHEDTTLPKIKINFSPTLNSLCNDGLGPEELWIILAATNRGKSSVLMNFAFSALQQNYKVIYYTFEMSPRKIGARLDSRFSRITTKSLREHTPEIAHKLQAHINSNNNSELIIKFYPRGVASVNTLISHLSLLEGYHNFKPDLIVIDYADIMRPVEKSNEKRHQQANIYGELFYLAQTRGVPVITGCQSNRTGQLKETVDLTEAGESYDKVQIADVVLSLNETKEEYENSKMRMFIAKNRDDKKWSEVQLTFDRSTMYVMEEEDDKEINSLIF